MHDMYTLKMKRLVIFNIQHCMEESHWIAAHVRFKDGNKNHFS